MFKEVGHFLYHAPATLALKNSLPQNELYDTLMARGESAGMGERRRRLVAGLRGEILEIGCGTGLMFRHYEKGAKVLGIEKDVDFLAVARERAKEAVADVRVSEADAVNLNLPEDAVDHVVIALVLCSVRNVGPVLKEVRRVLKPGGTLNLIEHVRSEKPVSGFLMDVFDPLWLALNGQGCHMNRNAEAVLRASGFEVDVEEDFQIFADGMPAFPMQVLRAR